MLERCPDELFKDYHRQTPKLVVGVYSLAIMPQPKGALFSHRKKWVVSTGLKLHKILRKQRFQHLKAISIHFMQFCGPWITHKNGNPIHLGQVLNDKKSLLVTFSTIFILLFHLAIGRQRCQKNLGYIVNTFYTCN